jgi:peptidoglycan DL-endopeptidase CwlO
MSYRTTTRRTFTRSYGRGGHNKGAAIGIAAIVLVAIAASKGAVGATSGTAPPSTASVAAEQAYAARLFGDGPAQQQCLGWLWNQESTWNRLATNSQSGAFGIAQALQAPLPGDGGLGGSEYRGYGVPASVDYGANNGNADDQIIWGKAYILSRYGSPCNAWDHEEAKSWY